MEQRQRNTKQQSNRKSRRVLHVINDKENIRVLNDQVRKANRRKKVACFLVGIAFLLMVLSSIKRTTDISALNTKRDSLAVKIGQLEADRDFLVMKLEPYKATARIEMLAKIQLGMDYPKQEQMVHIASGHVAQAETETTKDTSLVSGFRNFFSALFGTGVDSTAQ